MKSAVSRKVRPSVCNDSSDAAAMYMSSKRGGSMHNAPIMSVRGGTSLQRYDQT